MGARLYYPYDGTRGYKHGEYLTFPSVASLQVYICVEDAAKGESPRTQPTKFKIAFPYGGGGTVLSFDANSLSPLFTTSVSDPNTTPVLSFTAISQSPNLVYASPDGVSGVPLFRALTYADFPFSGLTYPVARRLTRMLK